jgi:cytochrome c biogenesis protein CcmG, thiol:disulfide interchange protein DsbE
MPLRLVPALRRRLAVPALAAMAALLAVACAAGATARPSSAGTMPAVNATAAPLLPTRADDLPDFTLARFDVLLAQLRGTPVVVNMWGSWCPPCKTEAPMLANAHATYGTRVQFVGIDIEDSVTSAREFIHAYDWTFPSIRDPDFPSSMRSGLGFAAQPNTLFYDASGRLVDTWQGELSPRELRSGIRDILPGR